MEREAKEYWTTEGEV